MAAASAARSASRCIRTGRPRRSVFVYVTRTHAGHLQNQLVRFTVSGGAGSNLRILLATPASASPYHNGGRILFGPDHKLYVVIGDGHNSANAQDRSGQPPRQDPAAGHRRNRRSRQSDRSDLVLRTPQLLRVHVRPTHGSPLGNGERPGVHRRDQPDREGRELRMGPERDLLDEEAQRHEQLRPQATSPAEGVLRVHDRHHGCGVLRPMRPRKRRERRPRVRRREHGHDPARST